MVKKNVQAGRGMIAADIEDVIERREISPTSFALWVRCLRQNWRQGTVGVKGRSDVSLSGKKPWKQKGTGRARAGTARSPLWRKGGVMHGPEPRVRNLKISKKQKNGVLNTLFWKFFDADRIRLVSFSAQEQPKTGLAHALLRDADLLNKKVLLFVQPHDALAYASFVNIPCVHPVFFDQAQAFDLADADCWVVLENDLDTFKQMVSQWN